MLFAGKREDGEKCLVVPHIPKTAGTTLRMIIGREYRSRESLFVYEKARKFHKISKLEGMTSKRKQRIRVLMGHFGMNIKDIFPSPFECFTLLRDPVEKILSQYAHGTHLNDRWRGRDVSIEEFVCSGRKGRIGPGNRNHMTRLLSGVAKGTIKEYIPEALLDMALENIDNHFTLTGISEMFDESVFLLSQKMGWRPPYHVRENVSKERPNISDIDEALLDVIVDNNKQDRLLYDQMKARFLDEWHAQDKQFHADFATFKIENDKYVKTHKAKVVWK